MKKIFLFLIMTFSLLFLLVGCTNEQNKSNEDELDLEDGFFYDKNDIYEDDVYLAMAKTSSIDEKSNVETKKKAQYNTNEIYEETKGIKEKEFVVSEEVKDILRKRIEMERFKPRCMTPMINNWRFSFRSRFH